MRLDSLSSIETTLRPSSPQTGQVSSPTITTSQLRSGTTLICVLDDSNDHRAQSNRISRSLTCYRICFVCVEPGHASSTIFTTSQLRSRMSSICAVEHLSAKICCCLGSRSKPITRLIHFNPAPCSDSVRTLISTGRIRCISDGCGMAAISVMIAHIRSTIWIRTLADLKISSAR